MPTEDWRDLSTEGVCLQRVGGVYLQREYAYRGLKGSAYRESMPTEG